MLTIHCDGCGKNLTQESFAAIAEGLDLDLEELDEAMILSARTGELMANLSSKQKVFLLLAGELTIFMWRAPPPWLCESCTEDYLRRPRVRAVASQSGARKAFKGYLERAK